MMKTTVSIITPVHNGSKYLRECLDSVISQSFDGWELIIIDDASSDNTLSIANTYANKDPRIKVFHFDHKSGPASARNKALGFALGRYISFLDSDDIWMPNKLKRQVGFMSSEGRVFSYSSYEKIDHNGLILGNVSVPSRVSYEKNLKGNVIGCLTAMYDTEFFGKVYMPDILKRQDYGLWLKLLKMTDYAYGIQEPLAQYRVHNDSISANKLSAAHYTWKLYREVEKLSYLKSAWYFSNYAVRGLLKSYK